MDIVLVCKVTEKYCISSSIFDECYEIHEVFKIIECYEDMFIFDIDMVESYIKKIDDSNFEAKYLIYYGKDNFEIFSSSDIKDKINELLSSK